LAAPLFTTTYSLTVEDDHSCVATDNLKVTVENRRRVYVPTAFSPNGDGINDVFSVFGGREVKEITCFKIFDRWGGLVFLAENLPANGTTGWDGTFQGKELAQGVYAYSIEVLYLNGERASKTGDLHLVR
jgi:gliding motility-associated-like protein